MPWIDIGLASDFPQGRGVAVVADGRRLAVFNADGQLYAVDDLCPHRRFPLNDGIVQGSTVRCRTHGSCFKVDTGELVRGPAGRGIGAYAVKLEETRVLVAMPD